MFTFLFYFEDDCVRSSLIRCFVFSVSSALSGIFWLFIKSSIKFAKIQPVKVNALEFSHRDPPAVRAAGAPETNMQLSVAALFLNDLSQLGVKLTVAAFLLQADPQYLLRAKLPYADRQLVRFCFGQCLLFAAAACQANVLPHPLSLQQLLNPAANFLQYFALPVNAFTSTPFNLATSSPAAASAASSETACPKLLFVPLTALSHSPSRQNTSPPQTICFPLVRVSQENVAYSCRQVPSSALNAHWRDDNVQAALLIRFSQEPLSAG
ncbi:Uncharacterised protein [Raoultella ornithinolytica]|nr:Uncharacterised protein [Raoultella ornithinolytica]